MSKLNFEREAAESVVDCGYLHDEQAPLGAWTLGAGTTIPAAGAGNVGRTVADTSINVIRWDDTADQADIIRYDWTLPGNFFKSTDTPRHTPLLQLLLKLRCVEIGGTVASFAAAQTIKCQLTMHNVGETGPTLPTAFVAKTAYTAAVADTASDGFAWTTVDLYGNMSAAQKLLALPLTTFQIALYPSAALEQYMHIDLASAIIRYRRHFGLTDPSLRVN